MKKILPATLLLLTAATQAAEPFIGKYRNSGADWSAELWLLDNQKFCYATSAGNMDMTTGGSWRKTAQKGDIISIRLSEQKLPISDVVIVANPKVDGGTLANAQKETGSRRILFLTPPALENALGSMNPIIAFGATGTPSGAFKWVYPENGGTPISARIGIPEKARYVFVGSTENNKLYRFNIGNSRHAKLNPNPQAGRAGTDMTLTYHVKTQILQEIGKRQTVSSQAQMQAWQTCEPKAPNAASTVKDDSRTLLNAEAVGSLQPHYQKGQTLEAWTK